MRMKKDYAYPNTGGRTPNLIFQTTETHKSSERENDTICVHKEVNGGICAVYIQ